MSRPLCQTQLIDQSSSDMHLKRGYHNLVLVVFKLANQYLKDSYAASTGFHTQDWGAFHFRARLSRHAR